MHSYGVRIYGWSIAMNQMNNIILQCDRKTGMNHACKMVLIFFSNLDVLARTEG